MSFRITFFTPLILGLIAYHAINVAHRAQYRFGFDVARLRADVGEQRIVHLETLINASDTEAIDFVSYRMARWARDVKENLGESLDNWNNNAILWAPHESIKPHFLEQAQILVERLEFHGIPVVIVPVPLRGAIEGQLLRKNVATSVADYRAFVAWNPKRVVNVMDPLRAYASQNRSTPLYKPDDHWTGLGISIAVEEITQFVPANVQRIIVAGTSLSKTEREKRRDLPTQLHERFEVPVINVSQSGGGTHGALQELIRQDIRLKAGDVLIWEFAFDSLRLKEQREPDSIPIPAIHGVSEKVG